MDKTMEQLNNETISESFSVKTSAFEGPLDVLLSLVEKRKLFVNEISLSKIADDYVCFVNSLDQKKTEDIADFVYIASTLLLIKSRSLLPNFNLTSEEEESVEDLQKRLKIYQEIKRLGAYVTKEMEHQSIFQKEFKDDFTPVFSPSDDILISNILESAKNLLEKLPKKEVGKEVRVKKIINLEEVIENLKYRVQENIKLSFKDFSGDKKEKVDVIVGFLAMLELVKQGTICANQNEHFGEITMEDNNISTPKYTSKIKL